MLYRLLLLISFYFLNFNLFSNSEKRKIFAKKVNEEIVLDENNVDLTIN